MSTTASADTATQFTSSEAGLSRERVRAWADGTGVLFGMEIGLQATAEWPFGIEAAFVIAVLTLFSALIFGFLLWAYPFSWQRSKITLAGGEVTFEKGDRRRVFRPSDVKRVTIACSPSGSRSQVRIRDTEGETYVLFDPENVEAFGHWAREALGNNTRERRLWPVEYNPLFRGITMALIATLAAMAPVLWM